ncbi:hypothetical protein Y032_0022g509 [Ancylostoma ceylanicum]|nr:hypothetical protein Y032_0022g509 [Ancylostoma ceylanicum]
MTIRRLLNRLYNSESDFYHIWIMDESEKHSKATGDDEEPLEDVKIDGVEELQDDIIEEVDVLYVSADDDIPEIAQEVITDGEYVEVVDEELLQPSSDPTHLVSNLEALRAGKHEAQLQWDYINTNLHASPVSQVASAGLDRRFVPKYPVSVARNCAVPSKQGPYLSAAPILNQRKTMLAYDLLASLPEEKRGHFIEFVDLLDKRLLCDPKFLSMPAANTLLRNSSRDCEEKVQYLSLSALDSCVSERIVDSTKQGTEISHEGETDPKEERVEERFVMTKRVDHFFKEGTATGQGRGVVEQGSVRFCPSCRMMLKRAIYYHHGRLIRKYGRCDIFTPKRFPCGDPGCHERLGTIEKLCDHMYQVHRAPTMIKHRVFNNEAEFQEFLIDLESSGNYRMPRGNKTVKGATVQYYRCNRMYSIPKSKITRLIDGIAAGDCYGNKSYANPMNPFEKETSTKPFLRTEGACTAFLRKSYLDNGKIQVRYCDYHLHSDDGVRLPRAIRSRIFEMTAKKLPAPVIVMVLRKECHQFCSPGSSLERRIMSITPREVHLTSLSFKRMLQKNEKRSFFSKHFHCCASLSLLQMRFTRELITRKCGMIATHSEEFRNSEKMRVMRKIRKTMFALTKMDMAKV